MRRLRLIINELYVIIGDAKRVYHPKRKENENFDYWLYIWNLLFFSVFSFNQILLSYFLKFLIYQWIFVIDVRRKQEK